MADDVTRTAARLGLIVAVPVAVLVGILVFGLLRDALAPGDAASSSPDPAATTPVTTELRTLSEREEVVCRALLSQVPQSLGELAQRPVTAGAEQNAAYGEPPVVLACGVPTAAVAPTDQVWVAGGVCWYANERDGATDLVSVDREVPVRLTVPDAHGAPLQWAAELGDVIVAEVPPADTAPTGCWEG